MAKEVKKSKGKPVSEAVAERFHNAVQAEAKAHGQAQSGNQLERLAAFRAMKELDAAHAESEASSAPDVAEKK